MSERDELYMVHLMIARVKAGNEKILSSVIREFDGRDEAVKLWNRLMSAVSQIKEASE